MNNEKNDKRMRTTNNDQLILRKTWNVDFPRMRFFDACVSFMSFEVFLDVGVILNKFHLLAGCFERFSSSFRGPDSFVRGLDSVSGARICAR